MTDLMAKVQMFQSRAKTLENLRRRREEIKASIDTLQEELRVNGQQIEETRLQYEDMKTQTIAAMRDEK